MTEPVLDVAGLTASLGGRVVLDGVDLAADAGTIVGLIGPNGAGKTTLIDCVSGLVGTDGGSVRIDGRDITRWPPFRRARFGVARTFQRLELFTSLSVRDNLLVAAQGGRRRNRSRVRAARRVDDVLARLELGAVADRAIAAVPTGNARRVDLARALMTVPRVLLLDEPASGQDPDETDVFGRVLLDLAADGAAIVLVEHDMSLVGAVCSTVYVVDFGRVIAVGAPGTIRTDPTVVEAYLGAM